MLPASRPNHDQLRKAAMAALKAWHQVDAEPGLLASLTLFQATQQRLSASAQQTTNEILYAALQRLDQQAGEAADLLRARFLDNELTQTIAHQKNWSEATFFRKQNEALDHLTQLLLTMEQEARTARTAQLLARLEPPTYLQLVGVEEQLERLATILTTPEAPWLVALEGMGGIGKTALADRVLRRLIDQGDVAAIGWTTARTSLFNLGGSIKPLPTPTLTLADLVESLLTQLLGAEQSRLALHAPDQALHLLGQQLHATPHVIVIDNLESLLDIAALLPTLRTWVNPSKFLLTSRVSLYAEADIYHFHLAELSPVHALRLIRYEAQLRNLPDLAQAGDAELQPILTAVGGNPLALRLVVGQLHVHPLPQVLADLATARGEKAENLYSYLYDWAWTHLAEVDRLTLLALPMLNEEGGGLDDLLAITQLAAPAVASALDRLVALNLVDCRGDLYSKRYTIHSLTRTFLHQQIAQWSVSAE